MSPSKGKLKQPPKPVQQAPGKSEASPLLNPLDSFLEEFSRLHERAKREDWYDTTAQQKNNELKARADIITAIFYALTRPPPSTSTPASAEQSPQRRTPGSPLRKSHSLYTTSFSRPDIWCDSPHYRRTTPKKQPDIPDATFRLGMKRYKSITAGSLAKNQKAGEGAENFAQIRCFLANIKLKQNFGRMLPVKTTYSDEPSTTGLPSNPMLRQCFTAVLKNHKANYLVPAGSAFVGVYLPFFGRSNWRQGESFEKSIINLLRKVHAAQKSLSAYDENMSVRSISMRSLGDVHSLDDTHSQMGISRAYSTNSAPGRQAW